MKTVMNLMSAYHLALVVLIKRDIYYCRLMQFLAIEKFFVGAGHRLLLTNMIFCFDGVQNLKYNNQICIRFQYSIELHAFL